MQISALVRIFVLGFSLLSQTSIAKTDEPLRDRVELENGVISTSKGPAGTSRHFYVQGRLVVSIASNHQVSRYHYKEGKLDKITFTGGIAHSAVYSKGKFLGLNSSSGQRLRFFEGTTIFDQAAFEKQPIENRYKRAKRNGPAMQALKAAVKNRSAGQSNSFLNGLLIDNGGWELYSSYECTYDPEQGMQVCTVVEDIDNGGGDAGGDEWGDEPWDTGTGTYDPDPVFDPGTGDGGGEYVGGGEGEYVVTPLPPGVGPNDTPIQMACYQAAYRAWLIVNAGECRKLKNYRDAMKCDTLNMAAYVEELAYCRAL